MHDDVVAGGGSEAGAQRRTFALVVRLQDDADARIRDAGKKVASGVGGAIVDNDDFVDPWRRAHAIEQSQDCGLLVVARHDGSEARAR